ncbi:MAG TPA: hypothetical protein VMW64_00900 [Dehalococcoidia bacterium]|nr:hypothetical protein [Dehalococcoidia bacterium]
MICVACKKEKPDAKPRQVHDETSVPLCNECFDGLEPLLKILVAPSRHVFGDGRITLIVS